MVLIDVVLVGVLIVLAFVALIFVFVLWTRERKDLKKRYRDLAAEGKKEMDDSPLVG